VKEIVLHPWRRIVTEYSLWRLARMRRLFVLNVIAWISLSTAIAQGGQSRDPCAGDSTQSAMTECANRALTAANAKLDKTYRRILASTDSSRRRLLQSAEAAWEKYRVTVAYERGERDRFSHILRDVIGLGTDFLEDRQIVRDDSLLFYSGLLGIHTRPAASLRQILWDYFDVPVEVEQLVGAWHILEDNNQCKFDKANTYSEQVGLGAIVGDEIWDQQSGVRVRLGPLTLKQYLDFLPTGTAYEPLQAILRFYSGWEIDYEVQLVLKRKQVPGCQLGDDSDEGPKLGWVSWAKNIDLNCDPDDTVLRV